MKTNEIDYLKERVSCTAVLERAGFKVDLGESTRRAIKYRRCADITIVIHAGKGWFDPLSDAKGDVLSLIRQLHGLDFAGALHHAADLVGFISTEPVWNNGGRERQLDAPLIERWRVRCKPRPGSAAWRYLSVERCLPDVVLRAALDQNLVREGPHGSMWAAHVNDHGVVTGWEERGPEWRGFATGGSKSLFRFGATDAARICVTEAAIDAMSLAAIEGIRDGSLYLSTGGGWSPTTEAAIRRLATRPGTQLIAATDANTQGEAFAGRLREIARAADCDWLRLRPSVEDWNEVLKRKTLKQEVAFENGDWLPHARRSRQG